MLNAVGREIPEEILERTGKEVFQGNNYKDGKAFQKASPKVTPVMRNDHDKMVKDIHEALVKCNAHDGMTVSFHHHFREGDLVVCMVMEEIHKMGFKNITLSASSLGKAHDALVPMIEDGTIVNIESSGVRGKIGDAISHGKLKGLATMRSHGGRVRAIETGETHVDIAFIGANGISVRHGLSTPDSDEAAVKRAMVRCANYVVVVADSSKIGREEFVSFASIDSVDALVTDAEISPADKRGKFDGTV